MKFVGHAADDTPATDMKLYYADENGMFGESQSLTLPRLPRANERHDVRVTIELPRGTQSLRLDPQQVAGKFRLDRLLVPDRAHVAADEKHQDEAGCVSVASLSGRASSRDCRAKAKDKCRQ